MGRLRRSRSRRRAARAGRRCRRQTAVFGTCVAWLQRLVQSLVQPTGECRPGSRISCLRPSALGRCARWVGVCYVRDVWGCATYEICTTYEIFARFFARCAYLARWGGVGLWCWGGVEVGVGLVGAELTAPLRAPASTCARARAAGGQVRAGARARTAARCR